MKKNKTPNTNAKQTRGADDENMQYAHENLMKTYFVLIRHF